jgi:hypothetical protein
MHSIFTTPASIANRKDATKDASPNYRDGELISSGAEEAFLSLDQSDPKRLLGAGVVQMGSQSFRENM